MVADEEDGWVTGEGTSSGFLGFFFWMNVEGKREKRNTKQGLRSNRSDTKFDVGRSESNSHTERIIQEFSNKLTFI